MFINIPFSMFREPPDGILLTTNSTILPYEAYPVTVPDCGTNIIPFGI